MDASIVRRRTVGEVQLSLLQELDTKRHKAWEQFYVNTDRLTPILFGHYDAKALRHKSVTDRFLGALDDEVDKSMVFFLDQQGQIARDLWELSTWTSHSKKAEPTASLYDHAVQLLRLVKFVDLNIRILERVLSLHDEIFLTNIETLYLTGRIGREVQAPNDHKRLKALLQPDSLKATVGIAATIYYRYIKRQATKNNRVNTSGVSLRQVPSMTNLAGFLASSEHNDIIEAIREEEETDEDDLEDSDEYSAVDDDGVMPEDMKVLVLTERALNRPVLSANTASPSAYSLGAHEDKLVGAILLRIDTAMTNLTRAASVMEYLALPDMVYEDTHTSLHTDSTDDLKGLGEIMVEHQKTVGSKDPSNKRKYSSWLNLSNSFLYMVSYYLVAPTSSAYARRLGLADSMSGAIIGMTAFSALASTVLYSWWTSHSYKHALIFSSICCLAGNLIYSAGLPFDSLTLVLIGRLLNGFGSARAINRRFIADAFSKSERTVESANFVAASAAGMSIGPALAAFMPVMIPKQNGHPWGNLWWQEENAAGWVMVVLWAIYLAFLIPYFKDPPKQLPASAPKHSAKKEKLLSLYNGEKKPLIPTELDFPEVDAEKPLWKRPAALVTIFLVFLLKLVLELVLSASAPVTDFYFDWKPSTTGWFLAALGGLVLPAIALVTYLAKKMEDRYLILYSAVGTLIGCFVMFEYRPPNYGLPQYMIGTIILFVFPNTMEAPTMSLLSKNIPSSLSRGLFNLGFFTTEAGFGGRVVADSVLTWCGLGGTEHLVNHTFGFLTVLNLLALALIYFNWSKLVDPAKKYD